MNPCHFALYAWRETTTLHVTFNKVAPIGSTDTVLNLKGELRVSFLELLKCFISLKGNGRGRFIHLLLQTLVRTYILQIPRGTRENFIVTDSYDKSYPSSTVDDIRTGIQKSQVLKLKKQNRITGVSIKMNRNLLIYELVIKTTEWDTGISHTSFSEL